MTQRLIIEPKLMSAEELRAVHDLNDMTRDYTHLLAHIAALEAEKHALLVRVLRLEKNCGWDRFYSESAKREADRILADYFATKDPPPRLG